MVKFAIILEINLITFYQRLVDKKPCFNPKQASDEELRLELLERGKNTAGNRDQMIRRLLQLENRIYHHITILTFVRQISVVMITRQTNINIVIESEP